MALMMSAVVVGCEQFIYLFYLFILNISWYCVCMCYVLEGWMACRTWSGSSNKGSLKYCLKGEDNVICWSPTHGQASIALNSYMLTTTSIVMLLYIINAFLTYLPFRHVWLPCGTKISLLAICNMFIYPCIISSTNENFVPFFLVNAMAFNILT